MINPDDLSVEVISPKSSGGQHAGTQPCAVKVTHIPTGVTASITQRSQFRAREIAVDMIAAALTHPKFE